MACGVCRIFYKKRKIIIVLCATVLFWILYLILILPTDSSFKVESFDHTKATPRHGSTKSIDAQKLLHQDIADIKADNLHGKNSVIKLNLIKPVPGQQINVNISIRSRNDSRIVSTSTSGLQIAKHLAQLKNKTYNIGVKFKEKLSNLGIISKEESFVKHIKRSSVFNLNMTDTEYMHIIKTLIDADNHVKNAVTKATGSTNIVKTVGVKRISSSLNESCLCYDISCSCCVRMQVSMLELKNVVCANLTFLVKTQQLDLKISLDKLVIYNESISAKRPPKICLGSMKNSLEICSTFSNVRFRVNMHEDHKTQLNGCIDFSLAVFNRTISRFPLGCFQIPGAGKTPYKFHNLGNWMT